MEGAEPSGELGRARRDDLDPEMIDGACVRCHEREALERLLAERTAQLAAAQEERERMAEQLQRADRLVAMGRLAAGVGHEVNNPLTYVFSGIDAVADDLLDLEPTLAPGRLDALRQNLRDVRDGLERIRQAVRDLKTFSRSPDEPRRPVSVQQVLETTLQLVHNEIRHRAVLVKDFSPTPPVLGNEARLGQVLLNLLLNAVQAIPEGGASANRVRVATTTDARGRVVIEVQDSGRGIPRAELERVFEPFFTTRQTQGGTGLGLSVSRSLVAAMGGTLTAESEPGRGACFRIELPPLPDDWDAEPIPAGPVAAPAAASARAASVRVLVVDDEPMVAGAVRRALSREHEVVAETSARAALARLGSGERFELVVCDLMMPEMAGPEFHAALVAARPDLALRTVFLTGGAFTPAARDFLERVPNRCLEKPFDAEGLRATVRRVVGGGTWS